MRIKIAKKYRMLITDPSATAEGTDLLQARSSTSEAKPSLVTAQQQTPTLQPSGNRKAAETPTQLLLEVNYNPAVGPGYSTVNGPEVKPKWIWMTKFIRIPGVKTAGPPIHAVKLESQFNGETADVRVTLFRGETDFDQEDLVAVYHLGVGEQRTIKELRAYGIEPFRIKLLNTVPPLPPPPSFENLTQTIDIASVRFENVPQPAYVVTFRNSSDKSVLALRIEVKRDGKAALVTLFHAEDGQPIIEPGGTADRYIAVTKAQATGAGDYEPGTASANTLVLRSAVFADLSFEGDVQAACEIESFRMGRRVWLRHVLPLLDEELQRPVNDHIEAARQFKEKMSALQYEFTESERNQVSSVSTACKKPVETAQMMTRTLKLKILRDLDEIITKRPSPPINFRNWLAAHQVDYKAWLARL